MSFEMLERPVNKGLYEFGTVLHYRYAILYIVRITIKYTIAVMGMPTCPRQASSVKGRNGHLGDPAIKWVVPVVG